MSKIPFPTREQLSLEGLQSQFGQLLESFWHRGLSTPPLDGLDWAPPVELREEPDRYVLLLEVPGVDRSALDVAAQPTRVVVRGEKLSQPSPEGEESPIRHTERRYGSFRRQIDLPGTIETEAVSASLAHGVLDISLPKARESRAVDVKVEVKPAASQGHAEGGAVV